MAKVLGTQGDVTFGGTALLVTEWTGNLQQTKHDVTDKGSAGWGQVAAGIKRLTGSFKGILDSSVHATGTFPVPFSSAIGAMTLSMDDGTTDGGSYSFNALIENLEFSSPVDAPIEFSGNFESNGVVTYNPPS